MAGVTVIEFLEGAVRASADLAPDAPAATVELGESVVAVVGPDKLTALAAVSRARAGLEAIEAELTPPPEPAKRKRPSRAKPKPVALPAKPKAKK